ncbi:hypothetical protein Cni_G16282 [Canna indica]|uniref:Phosphoglycolate phosphatase n=1 Tax=Canna indica TaxID=4628 RepID=A0AAQ3KIE1_9LILI|nr:hypothetical protein Cni_G16282 [Canna indica]
MPYKRLAGTTSHASSLCGDKLIDGVPSALQSLRSLGKKLVFVTNNLTKSWKQYAKKFTSLGLDVSKVVFRKDNTCLKLV